MNGEEETHPSFGWAQVNRVTSTPYVTLFDSEIRHHEFVELRIGTAVRQRDLNRDWIRGESLDGSVVAVRMSMAQWGALVSSFGSSGVPVTIVSREGAPVEKAPYEPRLAHSVEEVTGAVDRLMENVQAKVQAVLDGHDRKAGRREMADLLNSLRWAVQNAAGNAAFAATSLTEHVENVVTKARHDIEASVHRASAAGLSVGDAVAGLLDSPEAES